MFWKQLHRMDSCGYIYRSGYICFVDYGNAMLVVGDRIDRTTEFTRTFLNVQWHCTDRLWHTDHILYIWMRQCGKVMSRFNCPKLTGIDTCLSKTVLTVLCYCVAGDRTVFAGRRNNLDDIAIIFGPGALPSARRILWRMISRSL